MTDKISLTALQALREAMTDKAEWRQGTVEKYHVFVHDPESLGGTMGERVLLRANTHFPYAENIAAIVAEHNAMPVLLEIALANLAVVKANSLGDGYGYDNEATWEQIEESRVAREAANARLAAALQMVSP